MNYKAKHKDITSNREYGSMLWQWDEKKEGIFITCPACSAISHIESPQVYDSGNVAHCIVCSNRRCGTHFWPFLEDWKGKVVVCCYDCGRVRKTLRKCLPRGWSRAGNLIYCSRCAKDHSDV